MKQKDGGRKEFEYLIEKSMKHNANAYEELDEKRG